MPVPGLFSARRARISHPYLTPTVVDLRYPVARRLPASGRQGGRDSRPQCSRAPEESGLWQHELAAD